MKVLRVFFFLLLFFALLLLLPSRSWGISVTEILETLIENSKTSEEGFLQLSMVQQDLEKRSTDLENLSMELKISLLELQNRFDKIESDLTALENQTQDFSNSFEEYKKKVSFWNNVIIAAIITEAAVIIFLAIRPTGG